MQLVRSGQQVTEQKYNSYSFNEGKVFSSFYNLKGMRQATYVEEIVKRENVLLDLKQSLMASKLFRAKNISEHMIEGCKIYNN